MALNGFFKNMLAAVLEFEWSETTRTQGCGKIFETGECLLFALGGIDACIFDRLLLCRR